MTEEQEQLPRQMARLVKFVPDQLHQAERDREVSDRLGDSPLGRTLRQVSRADFLPQEWVALLECRVVISRLKNRDENIQIDYRAPDTGCVSRGMNELPLNEWSTNFGVPPGYRLFLFALTRQARPRMCLELGTAAGYSSLHIAQALAVNEKGILHTIESDKSSYDIGRETLWLLRDWTVTHLGFFDDVMDTLLPRIGALDLVFIDGAHTGTNEVRYAERLSEYLRSGSVVIYDDIHWSEDMAAAWEEIRQRREVAASLDLGKIGVILVRGSGETGLPFHFTSSVKGNFGVGNKNQRHGADKSNQSI